jgi:FKBP-type peptidyl-prolyl cis-trans isomerase
VERFDGVVDRQGLLKLSISVAMGLLLGKEEAKAMPPGFQKDLKNRRRIRDETVDISNFQDGPQGIKYLDVTVGDGDEAREGSRVAVHFDCKWRGITFVTTRQGMGVTGGSPFGFDVGAPVGQGGTLKGLDLGVRGMRVGGQRKLIVPSELAYGDKGYGEIPPNASLVIDVQLLSIKKNAIGTQVKLIEG